MKFRRRIPDVIEAEQFHEGEPLPFADRMICLLGPHGWFVDALEAPLHISEGDWIIEGVDGEFYPCDSEVFEANYEAVK